MSDQREFERLCRENKVEFFVDADVIHAETIDVSEGGLRMTTEAPIELRMRIHGDGGVEDRQASLVWAKRGEDGAMSYGLKFKAMPEW